MKYQELQIIKHALQQYIQRPNATKKEVEEEEKLLQKTENEIEVMKQRYGIK